MCMVAGWRTLISGERATLAPRSEAACLDDLALTQSDGSLVAGNPMPQPRLNADLQSVPPGPLTLVLRQAGQDPLSLPVQVLQPQARVSRIEHAEGSPGGAVVGIRVHNGRVVCGPFRAPCAGGF